MFHFDSAQLAAITQSRFFDRVAQFVCDQTPVVAYRDAALDKPMRTALWAPHWTALRDATEHDAALFMCFLLACATLHIDVGRAAAAVRQATQPEMSMKLFLSERGLLEFSAFDLPRLSRYDTGDPSTSPPMPRPPRGASVDGGAPERRSGPSIRPPSS